MSSADSIILFLASAIFGFALVLFLPIIPYIYKEAYDVPVIHEEQEQYIEKTPYTVEATVTKIHQLYTHSTNLGAITFEYKDVTIPSAQNVKITWASSTKLVLFLVMTNSAWDSFYRNLVLTMGLPAARATP